MAPSTDNSLTAHARALGWDVDESWIREQLVALLKKGADWAEFFVEHVASTRVIYEGGKVDKILEGTDRGLSLRILRDQRSWMGYTTDLSPASVQNLAQTLAQVVESVASASSRTSAPRPAVLRSFRAPEGLAPSMASYRIERDPRDVSLNDKIAMARRADAAARAAFASAQQVTALWVDATRRTLVVNSDGLFSPHSKTYAHMIAQVVGSRGARTETAYESDGGFVGLEFFDQRTPESIGTTAAERVKLLLDAKPAPAGTMPVVISSSAGGTMIHEAVGHGLEADLACNGLSVYEGKIGQTVASPLITVVDDGSMPARRGSYRVDDEGTPARKNVLIENGVLKGFMVDRLSALKFDIMATGNGRRESFRHKPIVRMTNTYIAPGKDDPDSILRDTKWGIFVKAMGGGQVNTVTGDFVFAVTEGYLIRDGKLGEPIRGATLVGNGPKVLSMVDRVGSDLGFATGTCGKDGQGAPVTDAQPTLRIPQMIVGGEVPLTEYWSA